MRVEAKRETARGTWVCGTWVCGTWVCGLLALFAAVVAGYHPFAEDGGVYVAGVKKLLDPGLYPAWTAFVTEHLRFSLFAPMVAGLVRGLHVPLEWVLLGLHLASLWATLVAGWMLASRFVEGFEARLGAVSLLACWLTLPIAGTSLMLMDPYLTARSLSTPLVLMALAWVLDRRWGACATALIAAATMHPLMAGYGLAAVLAVLSVRLGRSATTAFAMTGLAVAGIVQSVAKPESTEYVRVAVTRYYWFLSRWEWFEWLGLVAPLVVIWLLMRRGGWRAESPLIAPDTLNGTRLALGMGVMLLGATGVVVALVFCREGMATHLVARLQPLRCYQVVYEVMILMVGAWLGPVLLKQKAWRWALMLAVLGGTMFGVARQIDPSSAHLEWPGSVPRNAWERAFVWVRENTPQDALFALDARYITRGKGEDAQCFRAIAERSALPDYSKDGGEAAITPDLTDAWATGQTAQTGLETKSDAARLEALHGLGATWMVLQQESNTGWSCPYRNETVKVCRLP